jgi:hypothetical protein
MAVGWTLVILALCWSPAYWFNEVEKRSAWFTLPNLDKAIHWTIFSVFAVLWVRLGSSRGRYLWVCVGGIGLTALTELVQNLPIIGRDGNFGDALGDLLGVLAGLAIAPLVEPLFRRIESRLVRESTLAGVQPMPAAASNRPRPPAST